MKFAMPITEEEIFHRNKVIAQFMGARYTEAPHSFYTERTVRYLEYLPQHHPFLKNAAGITRMTLEEAGYHSWWAWIMPVLMKIKEAQTKENGIPALHWAVMELDDLMPLPITGLGDLWEACYRWICKNSPQP